MTAPARTPNPGTEVRPERSSKRVSRKSPLGWLPWALLGTLAALLLLTFLVVNAIDDDGPEGSAGDSLGQVSGDDGDSAVGNDGAEGGEGGESASGGSAQPPAASGGSGGGADLAQLSREALVGGGAIQSGPAAQTRGAEALASTPGTIGAVLFAEGSAEIDQNGQQVIDNAVRTLQGAGVRSVEVVGHTDVIAGEPVNNSLSQERADAVAAALGQGLPGVQITTGAQAERQPIASNDNEEGRQLNRRAVISARG
jgi:outer membrane protein OmpA-like peptidoglycan-associated protein